MMVLGVCSAARARESKCDDVPREEDDHAVVYELGVAGEWERASAIHTGGTLAFEVTPIEHWLELEVGVAAIKTDDGVEMPVDLLFKKPWRLSRQVEFMVGVGPELVHAFGSNAGTFLGLEGVVDVMFWRRKNLGWYVEPGYEMTFRGGTQHGGVGIAVGLLIGR